MKVRSLSLAALALAGLATALPAAAQFAKPEDAVKYRKNAMFVMAQHFGRIGAMASGRAPFDPKLAAENAEVVATMSRLPFHAFVEGTDKGETRAKPEIWQENEKFKAAAAKMQEDAVKLNAAAKTGDLGQLKAAFGATGQSCKACHDAFQKS